VKTGSGDFSSRPERVLACIPHILILGSIRKQFIHLTNWSMMSERPSTVRSGDIIRSCMALLRYVRFPKPLDMWMTLNKRSKPNVPIPIMNIQV